MIPGFAYALWVVFALGCCAIVSLEVVRRVRGYRLRHMRRIADAHPHSQIGQLVAERIPYFEAAVAEYNRLLVILLVALAVLSAFLFFRAFS